MADFSRREGVRWVALLTSINVATIAVATALVIANQLQIENGLRYEIGHQRGGDIDNSNDVQQNVTVGDRELDRLRAKAEVVPSELGLLEGVSARAILYRIERGQYDARQEDGRWLIVNPHFGKFPTISDK